MYLDCSLFSTVIKAIQPDCDKTKGISVLLLETPLTRSKYISPHTHTRTTSYVNIGNLLHIRVQTNPSLVENPMSRGRRDKFWIVSSGLRPYSDFSKHLRKSRTVASASNQIQGESTYTSSDQHLQKKRDK